MTTYMEIASLTSEMVESQPITCRSTSEWKSWCRICELRIHHGRSNEFEKRQLNHCVMSDLEVFGPLQTRNITKFATEMCKLSKPWCDKLCFRTTNFDRLFSPGGPWLTHCADTDPCSDSHWFLFELSKKQPTFAKFDSLL